MTDEERTGFVAEGRNRLTTLHHAIRGLGDWAAAFEQRGGGVEFGDDATHIVYIANAASALLTPERLATISRLRTDV